MTLGVRAGACKLASGELVTLTATCTVLRPAGCECGEEDTEGAQVQLKVVDMMARTFVVDVRFLDLCEAARGQITCARTAGTADHEKESEGDGGGDGGVVQHSSVEHVLQWLTDGRAARHFSLARERGVPRELVFGFERTVGVDC